MSSNSLGKLHVMEIPILVDAGIHALEIRLAAGPDRELPSHGDLVPSHPMKKNLIPSHPGPVPVPSRDGMGAPGPVPRMLLFYNIHTNIRPIQLMNISLESAHQELHN